MVDPEGGGTETLGLEPPISDPVPAPVLAVVRPPVPVELTGGLEGWTVPVPLLGTPPGVSVAESCTLPRVRSSVTRP
jgi:hypothetical protein